MKYLFKKIEPKWQGEVKSSKPKITAINLSSMAW